MTPAPVPTRAAFASAVGCYLIWGFMPLLFMGQAAAGFDAPEILAHRALWSVLFAGGLVLLAGQWPQVRVALAQPRTVAWLTLATVLIALNWGVYVWATTHQATLEASLGYYINPLLNMVVGLWLFRERIDRWGWVAIGLAAVGVLFQALALGRPPWISLFLAFSFGAYGIIKKRVPVEAQSGLFIECLLLLPFGVAFVVWLELAGAGHGFDSATQLGWAVLNGPWTVLPLALFAFAARRMPLSTMGFIQFLAPSLQFCVGLFALASVACGLAPTVELLIGGRALQGVGAALLTPGALALIGASFPTAERGRAFGTWAGFGALTGMIGPLVGGWLADQADWRLIFWINLPLAAVTMFVALRVVPESRDPDARGLDWLGALLAFGGLAALTWGLTAAPDRGLSDPLILAGLIAGAALMVGFLLVETREPHPMMPLGLFRSPVFSGINLLTLLLYFALGGAMFFLPFDLIRVQGWSATEAGAALLPFAVIMGLFSGAAGRIADRFGARLSLSLGPILTGVGLALIALPGRGSGYVDGPLAGMTVTAVGMTLAVGPLTAAVMGAVDAGKAGIASGVNNAVARVAGLLAIALLGLVLSAVFAAVLTGPDARGQLGLVMAGGAGGGAAPDAAVAAFHTAFRVVMLLCAACAVAAGVIGLLTAPGRAQSAE